MLALLQILCPDHFRQPLSPIRPLIDLDHRIQIPHIDHFHRMRVPDRNSKRDDGASHSPQKFSPSLPPPVAPICSAMFFDLAHESMRRFQSIGLRLELSSARMTVPCPIGAYASCADSSGVSDVTNMSTEEDEVRLVRFRDRSGAARAELFLHRPHEDHGAGDFAGIERARGLHERRASEAVVHRARGITVAGEFGEIFANGDRVEQLDAERLHLCAR